VLDTAYYTDHETRQLPSDFWADVVAAALNGDSEDDDSPLNTIIEADSPHYSKVMEVNLCQFDIMDSGAIRKKFNMLMKVPKIMKHNMTVSGEHDNYSYNFVDEAMKKAGATPG
jgi:hypothetical protein